MFARTSKGIASGGTGASGGSGGIGGAPAGWYLGDVTAAREAAGIKEITPTAPAPVRRVPVVHPLRSQARPIPGSQFSTHPPLTVPLHGVSPLDLRRNQQIAAERAAEAKSAGFFEQMYIGRRPGPSFNFPGDAW